jgi:hypothetical protein
MFIKWFLRHPDGTQTELTPNEFNEWIRCNLADILLGKGKWPFHSQYKGTGYIDSLVGYDHSTNTILVVVLIHS